MVSTSSASSSPMPLTLTLARSNSRDARSRSPVSIASAHSRSRLRIAVSLEVIVSPSGKAPHDFAGWSLLAPPLAWDNWGGNSDDQASPAVPVLFRGGRASSRCFAEPCFSGPYDGLGAVGDGECGKDAWCL